MIQRINRKRREAGEPPCEFELYVTDMEDDEARFPLPQDAFPEDEAKRTEYTAFLLYGDNAEEYGDYDRRLAIQQASQEVQAEDVGLLDMEE